MALALAAQSERAQAEPPADLQRQATACKVARAKNFTGIPNIASLVAISPAQHLAQSEPVLAQVRGGKDVSAHDIAGSIQSRLELGHEVIATGRASTRFAPGPASKSHAAIYIARRQGGAKAAEVKAQAHKLLTSYKLISYYAGLLSTDRHFITEENGSRADDIADIMAATALFAYQTASGQEVDMWADDSSTEPAKSPEREGVRAQMRGRVLADAALQGGDNSERRFVAELFQMLAMHAFNGEAKPGTPAELKAKSDARLIFKYATGLDIDKASLTSEGFVPAAR